MPDRVLITTTAVAIHRHGQNFSFGEGMIDLHMVDETGGAFFELRQEGIGPIRADIEDLVAIVKAAKQLLKQTGVDSNAG